ncbi:MAG: hypothetical protein WB622_16855 [Acidobacteriaceae bacterium]
MVRKIGLLVLLLFPAVVVAQNSKSATGGEGSVWAGGGMSTFNPDWGCTTTSPFCGNQLIGPAVFGDFNLHDQYGVEAEARWLHWHPFSPGLYEDNYLVGPRDRVFRWHGLLVWIKLEIGGAWIQTPGYPAAGSLKGSYFAFVPGGTFEYRLTRNLSVRGDYDFEIWPSFAGPPSYSSTGALVQHASGLTPNGFTFGVSYRVLGH